MPVEGRGWPITPDRTRSVFEDSLPRISRSPTASRCGPQPSLRRTARPAATRQLSVPSTHRPRTRDPHAARRRPRWLSGWSSVAEFRSPGSPMNPPPTFFQASSRMVPSHKTALVRGSRTHCGRSLRSRRSRDHQAPAVESIPGTDATEPEGNCKKSPTGGTPARGGRVACFVKTPRGRIAVARCCGLECPRQESNLVCDLRRVACGPAHSKDNWGFRCEAGSPRHAVCVQNHAPCQSLAAQTPSSVPARNRTWSTTIAKSRAIQHTPRTCTQYPAEDSNLVRRFRTPSCLPNTCRAQSAPRPRPETTLTLLANLPRSDCRSRARTGPSGLMKASGVPTTCSDLREIRTPIAMTAQRSERCVSANSTIRSLVRERSLCGVRIPRGSCHRRFLAPTSFFSASPMGFEPTTSALTGQRALRTAPRGQTFLWHPVSRSARPMTDTLHAGARRRAGRQQPTCQPE
jgi:hypothetical protein